MRRWLFSLKLALLGATSGLLLAAGALFALSGRPVSAGVSVIIAILALAATRRQAEKADRIFAQVLAQFAVEADDQPAMPGGEFPRMQEAIRKARQAQAQRRQRSDRILAEQAAMLDCVPAALFEMEPGGDVVPANYAARKLAGGRACAPLSAMLLTQAMVAEIVEAGPGQARLVRLADNRAVLAGIATFTPTGSNPRRLIALQLVNEELSVIELNAWQGMARVLSHELMNSLAPVISLAESLATAAVDNGLESPNDVAETAGLIGRRAVHVMNFVERYREVLDLPEPEMTNVGMQGFVDDLVRLTKALPGGHAVTADVDPPGLTGRFDRELIEQALLNLLKNAAEAIAGRSNPAIRIACRSEGDHLNIEITDNGPGFPVDSEDIFVPFFTTKEEGSGIGLTIARRIALAHGGKLVSMPCASGAWLKLQIPRH